MNGRAASPIDASFPGCLVGPEWLAQRIEKAGLAVADVRWVPGGDARAAYEAGHIPGAAVLDVDRDLAATPGGLGGRHPLPDPESFAESMRAAGISGADAVVAYDDVRGSVAARLWWMLFVTGHEV